VKYNTHAVIAHISQYVLNTNALQIFGMLRSTQPPTLGTVSGIPSVRWQNFVTMLFFCINCSLA